MRLVLGAALFGLACTTTVMNEYVVGTGGASGSDVSVDGAKWATGGSGGTGGADDAAPPPGTGTDTGTGGTIAIDAGPDGSDAATSGGSGGTGGTGGVLPDAGKTCSGGCQVYESCVAGFCKQVIMLHCGTSCPAGFPQFVDTIPQSYECDTDECVGGAPPGVVCAVSSSTVISKSLSCPTGAHLSLSLLDCASGSNFNYCIAN